jgi:serpin B
MCVAKMDTHYVKLTLPRFKMTRGLNLRDLLTKLGMPSAFDPSEADFSGINGRRPPSGEALYLEQAWHKASVEVNEGGTEAAAATALEMALMCVRKPPPDPIFRADHPFLFAIREKRRGVILFLGRVDNPKEEVAP